MPRATAAAPGSCRHQSARHRPAASTAAAALRPSPGATLRPSSAAILERGAGGNRGNAPTSASARARLSRAHPRTRHSRGPAVGCPTRSPRPSGQPRDTLGAPVGSSHRDARRIATARSCRCAIHRRHLPSAARRLPGRLLPSDRSIWEPWQTTSGLLGSWIRAPQLLGRTRRLRRRQHDAVPSSRLPPHSATHRAGSGTPVARRTPVRRLLAVTAVTLDVALPPLHRPKACSANHCCSIGPASLRWFCARDRVSPAGPSRVACRNNPRPTAPLRHASASTRPGCGHPRRTVPVLQAQSGRPLTPRVAVTTPGHPTPGTSGSGPAPRASRP